MTPAPLQKIVILGNSLAIHLCAAKLIEVLPNSIDLIWVRPTAHPHADIFYGTVTSPTTYAFLLNLGITEPDLLPKTNTSFSLGTKYQNWGSEKRSWTQSFHQPLPILNGVEFQHYLTRLRTSDPEISNNAPYIMSVQAAESGVFAHPPEGRKTPLADMDYGYHFLPEEWRGHISSKLETSRIINVFADVVSAQRDVDILRSVTLSNGDVVEADFFIDSIGPDSKTMPNATNAWIGNRRLKATSKRRPSDKLDGVCRVLTAANYGWASETPLRGSRHRLTLYCPESESIALKDHGDCDHPPVEVEMGRTLTPWIGNCLTLGHGAAVVEPMTPAPMMLLQRDIQRLSELIPVSNNMPVEAREYNRRFNHDYDHAEMFQRAICPDAHANGSPYWQKLQALPIASKLARKIEQFESRGIFVQYDYEPFDKQDWAMLHFGMGRLPERYDRLADGLSIERIKNQLVQMRAAVNMMAKKMPPHQVYMSGLLRYLKEQHG